MLNSFLSTFDLYQHLYHYNFLEQRDILFFHHAENLLVKAYNINIQILRAQYGQAGDGSALRLAQPRAFSACPYSPRRRLSLEEVQQKRLLLSNRLEAMRRRLKMKSIVMWRLGVPRKQEMLL